MHTDQRSMCGQPGVQQAWPPCMEERHLRLIMDGIVSRISDVWDMSEILVDVQMLKSPPLLPSVC